MRTHVRSYDNCHRYIQSIGNTLRDSIYLLIYPNKLISFEIEEKNPLCSWIRIGKQVDVYWKVQLICWDMCVVYCKKRVQNVDILQCMFYKYVLS